MADKQVYPSTSSDDATAVMEPGGEWDALGGKVRYKYVLAEDLALVANWVVEYSDASGNEVTGDRAGGASLGRVAAGVALAAVTDAQYGVIQIGGVATMLTAAAASLSAGAYLVPHATVNGAVAAVTTTSEEQVFAVALAASTDTTSAVGTVAAKILRV